MANRQELWALLDEINRRPEMQQLGRRPQAPGPSMWERARPQPTENYTPAPENILPDAGGAYGGSGDSQLADSLGIMGQSATQGALGGLFSDKDVLESAAKFGLNPGMMAANMAANAFTKNYGFDQTPNMNRAGSVLGALALGPVGGILGGVVGGAACDYYGDYKNSRDAEAVRDYFEDNVQGLFGDFGGLAGRATYAGSPGMYGGGWRDVQPSQRDIDQYNITPEMIAQSNVLNEQTPGAQIANNALWGGGFGLEGTRSMEETDAISSSLGLDPVTGFPTVSAFEQVKADLLAEASRKEQAAAVAAQEAAAQAAIDASIAAQAQANQFSGGEDGYGAGDDGGAGDYGSDFGGDYGGYA